MQNKEELEQNLIQFQTLTTEKVFFSDKIFLSKGALYFAQNARCFWLFNAIDSAINDSFFNFSTLNIKIYRNIENGLVIEVLNESSILYSQIIPAIYFPFDTYEINFVKINENNKQFFLATLKTEV